jgi:hypothetical protein
VPRFSLMSHCQVCGREITQAGSARKWVHVDQFYGRADHEPEPRENNKFILPKKSAPTAAKPLTEAERRRKMREGAPEPTQEKAPGKRPRPGPPVADQHNVDIDDAARRLRRLRLGLDPEGDD